MNMPNDKTLKWFDGVGKARPSHEEHGISDTREKPLSEQLIKGNCHNWHLEGNELCCDSDFGPMRQTIPTNYICLGEKDGLPILKKIGV